MFFAAKKIKFVLAYMRGTSAINITAVQKHNSFGKVNAAAVSLIRIESMRVIDVRSQRSGEQTTVNADADHDVWAITFLLDLRMP